MIFISHSTPDDEFVDRLRDSLMRLGYQTWVDHYDIPAGLHWDDVVEDILKKADVMILVLSPASVASPNVKVEWKEFKDLGKLIIPVIANPCTVPLLIRHLNHVDFANVVDEESYLQQFTRLRRALPNSLPVVQLQAHVSPMDTRNLPMNTKEIELIRIRTEAQQLQRESNAVVGFDQLLFTFPDVGKSKLIDLDMEKMFIGWSTSTDMRPEIDLNRFGAFEYGVSRQHALLTRSGASLSITDLGSQNGTFIDKKQIPAHKPVVLKSGAIIHLGGLAAQIFFKLTPQS